MSLTQTTLQALFYYKDGRLYRRTTDRGVGTLSRGRLFLEVSKRKYLLHRIIFLHQYGHLPDFIDHIDGNPLNNKIENLREATLSQNQGNRRVNKNNSSGYKGVSLDSRRGRWQAKIYLHSKRISLGSYITKEEAAKAYNQAAIHYFGEFAKLNEVPFD